MEHFATLRNTNTMIKLLLPLLLCLLPITAATAQFPTIPGRIAISSDGNDHDCDDITATAMTIALLARTSNASKLVYYGHSDHHWSSNLSEVCGTITDREAEMAISSHDTAELWGAFDLNVFINAKANTAAAIANLVTQINASSAGNPLWIIAAGPMDVIGQALAVAGANKDHVTVISHSTWNDNHSDNPEANDTAHTGWTWAEMQSANSTVTFTHIADQNPGLNVTESNYFWLRDSYDPRLRWIWDRHVQGGEASFDPSDAGMLYWLITGGGGAGDEGATPRKVRFILEPNVYPAQSAAWDTATPAEMGFDATAFAAALAACPDKTIVIRNGYVVGTKGNIATTGLVWSASKSLVALIFARQLYLNALTHDQTVAGSDVPTTPLATYRQFLSMSSDYGLNPHAPGTHFAYNNGGYHHVGTHLKTTFYTGRTHIQTLQDAFVNELGFENALGYNTSGFMSGWDGGWSMSTQDMARIAYLVLRSGNWKGEQVLSAPFIANLYLNQIPAGATFSTDTDDQFFNESNGITGPSMEGAYSFGFWLSHEHEIEGTVASSEAINMWGAFGTSVYISRLHNVIVATVNTGTTVSNPGPMVSGAEYNAIINSIVSPTPAKPTVCKWGATLPCSQQ